MLTYFNFMGKGDLFRIPWRPQVLGGYINLKSGDIGFNWEIFKKFLQVQNYFIGLYQNTTDEDKFNNIQTEFYRWLWCNGELFITFFNENIQLWSINQKECDGIIVKKVKVQLITENLQLYQQNQTQQVEFTNFIQGIYIVWNPVVIPALVWWWDYLCKIHLLEKQFLNNTKWDSKRWIYTMNNQDEQITTLEIESFSDVETPFIKNVAPMSLGGKGQFSSNIFTELDMGVSQSDQAYNNLINYQNYVWNMMGMMGPVNLKKERKTTSEATLDVYNTLNIEDITLRELKKFEKWAKKLGGLNLKFERTTDIMESTDDKEFREEDENDKSFGQKVGN